MLNKYFLFLFSVFFSSAFAQQDTIPLKSEIHGNFQIDAQYYNPDSAIGAPPVPAKMGNNAFSNIIYTYGKFSAGVRYESYQNVLVGYPPNYKGTGIPYRYATYKFDDMEITVGNYYEQFGSGLIFRSYEERGLGYDNVMDGIRIKYNLFKGIYLKGLIGKQRLYFSQGPGIVRGFDGEIQFNETFKKLEEKKTKIILGGSFVSKFQERSPSDQLVYPENVGASAVRLNIIRGNFNFGGEYAHKINDPAADNGYIYKPGDALLLMATYARKGFSFSLNAKRLDNMYFRSDRHASVTDLLINYSPALTKQHTYSLLAFYPYASQPNGEMSTQGELNYKFKKETKLGGKYGMDLNINFSGVNSIDTTQLNDLNGKRIGYKSDFFSVGKTVYFRDLVVELNRKFSKKIKATAVYAHQVFNIAVVQGKVGHPLIVSDITVTDITYKIKSDQALRFEIEHLATKEEKKNWAMALVECNIGSKWFFALQDQYNYGNDTRSQRIHYMNFNVGYVKDARRITLSYGKQRAGIFCVGGICRNVPATNGFAISITNSF